MKVGRDEVNPGQLIIGHFDASRINARVEFGLYSQSLLSGSGCNQVKDDIQAHQGPTAPVLSDVTKHAMFNLVPFAGARGEMANLNRETQTGCQHLQSDLPQPTAAPVAATSICRDEKFACLAMIVYSHVAPPAPEGLGCKVSRIMGDADTHPTLIPGNIIDPIGDGFPQVFGSSAIYVEV
jgi:hypothetical protein